MDSFLFFFFNDTATTEIYTLSLHDALPILEELDLSFHEQIAVMSHNILIMETFAAIRNFFNRCIKNSVHLIYLNGEKNQDIIDYHIYIFDAIDRKSTRLNSSHANISYAVFCLKK